MKLLSQMYQELGFGFELNNFFPFVLTGIVHGVSVTEDGIYSVFKRWITLGPEAPRWKGI